MESNTGYVKDLSDWMTLRNYSVATIKAYGSALRQFLAWRESSGLGPQIALKDARAYLLHRYKAGRRWQTINGHHSAAVRPVEIPTVKAIGNVRKLWGHKAA